MIISNSKIANKKIFGIEDLTLNDIKNKISEGYSFKIYYFSFCSYFHNMIFTSSIYFSKKNGRFTFSSLPFILMPLMFIILMIFVVIYLEEGNFWDGTMVLKPLYLIFCLVGSSMLYDIKRNFKGIDVTQEVVEFMENRNTSR